METSKTQGVEPTTTRMFAFTTAFYWRFLIGFIFLNWVANIFFLILRFAGVGELAIFSGASVTLLNAALNIVVFSAVTFGVIYIVIGSPVRGFAIILTSNHEATRNEVEPTFRNIFPVWLSIIWKFLGAYLLISTLVAIGVTSVVNSSGSTNFSFLRPDLTISIATLALLFPILILIFHGIMKKRFGDLQIVITPVE